jgi:predicted RNA-binding Zn ribbon-like protein
MNDGVAGSGQEPVARDHAPGPLGLVQAFVNTRDIEGGTDRLATSEGLMGWLREVRLPGADEVGPVGLSRAVQLREAFRRALESNAHLDVGDPTSELSAAAAGIAMRVVGSAAGPRVEPGGIGLEGALGALLAAAATATADGSWARLKVCRNDTCRWAYWDASRNRSGVWCTMATCGNRSKGRAFRQRRSGSAAG